MMKAFILAAGFGTRLWPLTEDRTKAAMPFLNRPLIAYSVEYLASHGIRDIIVNLHHQPDSIRRALGDGSTFGVRITYSLEEEILGTSGALDAVRESLLDDDFLVINGKIITNIDLGQAIAEHRTQKALATLVLKENVLREHFSVVEVDSRRWITRFAGFPDAVSSQAVSAYAIGGPASTISKDEPVPLMFTGIQVLSPRIFDYIPRGCFSHSTIDVYPRAIAQGEAVIADISTGDWYEMSTLSRYLEASLRLGRGEGRSIIAGEGCVIDDGASVEDAVLWNNVTVERGARVSHSVLAEGVRIPAGSQIERAVVVRREAASQIERGEIAGENIIVPI
jgi:NDP-sugar pyrophosphorylase family protein